MVSKTGNASVNNRGAWTSEEDRRLAEAININGPNRWTTVAAKAGVRRCAKSCRLRWMNYLRPNIKRGDFSDQEDDLIIRLHKLLGNRWSLIAARLPSRTDNEIKNYWNCHLSKKEFVNGEVIAGISFKETGSTKIDQTGEEEDNINMQRQSSSSSGVEDSFNGDDSFFDFSNENPSTLKWLTKFVQFDHA